MRADRDVEGIQTVVAAMYEKSGGQKRLKTIEIDCLLGAASAMSACEYVWGVWGQKGAISGGREFRPRSRQIQGGSSITSSFLSSHSALSLAERFTRLLLRRYKLKLMRDRSVRNYASVRVNDEMPHALSVSELKHVVEISNYLSSRALTKRSPDSSLV